MIFSMILILVLGFCIGWLLRKVKIPGLVGMIVVGMIIGPYCLNLIDENTLAVSSQLRQLALVIILTRSGLNLNIESLKKIGRPAILMCFVPATFEIAGVALMSYFLFNLPVTEGILLGSVLAAVSPAVVSPRMIKLIDERFGEEHEVPKLILAGSSVDDIYVIVIFYAFLGLAETGTFNFMSLVNIPVSIALGILLGILVGTLLSYFIKHTHFNTPIYIIVTLLSSGAMIMFENAVKPYVSVSALLGVIVVGMILLFKNKEKAKELSKGYNILWKFFEIILFVLVGATVDFSYAIKNAGLAIAVLLVGLAFRIVGVWVCLLGTKLTRKEKIFTMIAYLPKATVQASIGGIALAHGLPCGATILTVAVISILITAPVGAMLIDLLGKKLLKKTETPKIDGPEDPNKEVKILEAKPLEESK